MKKSPAVKQGLPYAIKVTSMKNDNESKKAAMKKVHVPAGRPLGRIVCPNCGNDRDFVEIARNVIVTTTYLQNEDGSFTPDEGESDVLGKVGLFCGLCDSDLSFFHNHLSEMIF